ncbi:hypothetical protein A6g_04925 [Bacillus velezensis]|nr:hypothetical protein A6g_04925 [Bacillus velezensis]
MFNLLLINSAISISGNRCAFFNCLIEAFEMFLVSVNKAEASILVFKLRELSFFSKDFIC